MRGRIEQWRPQNDKLVLISSSSSLIGWSNEYKKKTFDLWSASLWLYKILPRGWKVKQNHLCSGRNWSWKYSSSICGVCFLLSRDYRFSCEGANSNSALFVLGVRNHCLWQIRPLHTYVFELCRLHCFYFEYVHLKSTSVPLQARGIQRIPGS